jgi:hypothetical protein
MLPRSRLASRHVFKIYTISTRHLDKHQGALLRSITRLWKLRLRGICLLSWQFIASPQGSYIPDFDLNPHLAYYLKLTSVPLHGDRSSDVAPVGEAQHSILFRPCRLGRKTYFNARDQEMPHLWGSKRKLWGYALSEVRYSATVSLT